MDYNLYAGAAGKKDDDADNETGSASEPEYSFEGYSIEFNDKIVLTPVTAGK